MKLNTNLSFELMPVKINKKYDKKNETTETESTKRGQFAFLFTPILKPLIFVQHP